MTRGEINHLAGCAIVGLLALSTVLTLTSGPEATSLGWAGSLLAFAAWTMTLGEDEPVEEDEEEEPAPPSIRREWRQHEAARDEGMTCTGCGGRLRRVFYTPWWKDGEESYHSQSEHYCDDCADLRQMAEALGVDGVKEALAKGRLTRSESEEMLAYLVRLEEAA